MLFYDHEHIIESCAGVQQGHPLGPLYFCCGIMAMVNDIQAMNPIENKWYMDDGGIIGDVELLKEFGICFSLGTRTGPTSQQQKNECPCS